MHKRCKLFKRQLSQFRPLTQTARCSVPVAQALVGLSVTPSGRHLRQDLLLVVPPPQRRTRTNGGEQKSSAGPRADASGDRSTVAAAVGSPDAGGEAQAARTRLAAAQALGQLASAWGSGPIPAALACCGNATAPLHMCLTSYR